MMFFFFFNDTATTEIYTLSLHDALPIWSVPRGLSPVRYRPAWPPGAAGRTPPAAGRKAPNPAGRRRRGGVARSRNAKRGTRSEEHTSELQSRQYLVCRLLLEKKKKHENI